MISGLSHCAGVVLAEKQVTRLKHIEFVPLEPGKALVVLVGEDQTVENRIINLPQGLPPSALVEAANYLNAHIRGLTIARGARPHRAGAADGARRARRADQKVIQAGLAEWSGSLDDRKSLIVRGQANLLKDVNALEDLERIRQLFDDLERKRDLVQLLGLSESADGVRIFIGSENKLFSLSGSSLIVAPFHDERAQGRRRAGRHRPDAHQLCPHHSHGGLHGQAREPTVDLIFAEHRLISGSRSLRFRPRRSALERRQHRITPAARRANG